MTEKGHYRDKDEPEERGHAIKTFRQEKRDEDGQDAFSPLQHRIPAGGRH